MAFLDICFLLLANFLLLDYLGKLFYERFAEWHAARRLIGNHPEMLGVDVGRDDLLYFMVDEVTRVLFWVIMNLARMIRFSAMYSFWMKMDFDDNQMVSFSRYHP